MWTTGRLLVMFVLFKLFCYSRTLRSVEDMNWETDPRTSWPVGSQADRLTHRIVIFLLNIPNYLDNGLEKTYIASGVLLDNSRILTSYNPFRSLISSSNFTDNILALLVTGVVNFLVELKIANVVCGRQIAYVSDYENQIWSDSRHSPLHDLMVIGMEEEVGIANDSIKFTDFVDSNNFSWSGTLGEFHNTMISFLAGSYDTINPEVRICSLGYRIKEKMKHYDIIIQTDYKGEDDVLVDCEEWLPRNWGFFICIKYINDFPGLGSGATLYSKNKLFGIGSFAMFKNDTGVLVFTDVRRYEELINKTCGDEEFT